MKPKRSPQQIVADRIAAREKQVNAKLAAARLRGAQAIVERYATRIQFRGRTVTFRELANELGLTQSTVRFRYRAGMREEELVTGERVKVIASPFPVELFNQIFHKKGGAVDQSRAPSNPRLAESGGRMGLDADFSTHGF